MSDQLSRHEIRTNDGSRAIAILQQWCEQAPYGQDRNFHIEGGSAQFPVLVVLIAEYDNLYDDDSWEAEAPDVLTAATRAIDRWKEDADD